MGYFWGHPRPHFIAGLTGLVGLRGTSIVGIGASSLSKGRGVSGLSSLTL